MSLGRPRLAAGPGLALCAALATALAGCASSRPAGPLLATMPPGIPPGQGVQIEDSLHGAKYELPSAEGGWQSAREGTAEVGGGAQVEVASFPLPRAATPPACRDTARTRLAAGKVHAGDDDELLPVANGESAPPLDAPREQAIGDAPTATWSFTRGNGGAAIRSRWAFYARGADCVMLEVTGPLGDPFSESVFGTAARSFQLLPLPLERQREVDMLAGMGFLERREPAAALERFEGLARREPGFSKAHFGALMAGFEIGAGAYARALPHGEAALASERDLSPEQRQLALRAVGVIQLAQNRIRNAADTLAELVVRAPDLAEGQYNYACALARLGDKPGAIDHLRTAVHLDSSLAAHAKDDEDLTALHPLPDFQRLVREPAPEKHDEGASVGPPGTTP